MRDNDISAHQAVARRLVAQIDAGDAPIDDTGLDAALDLRIDPTEARLDTLQLLARYGVQRFEQGDLAYEFARALYRGLRPELERRPLRLLDLGAGYGRIGLYGALRHDLVVHGLELVAERVVEARRAAQALGLTGLSFEVGDLLEAAWPPAEVYCMMNAVLPRLLPPVVERLRGEASRRRIIVASVSTSNGAFAQASWLRPLPALVTGPAATELRLWESL